MEFLLIHPLDGIVQPGHHSCMTPLLSSPRLARLASALVVLASLTLSGCSSLPTLSSLTGSDRGSSDSMPSARNVPALKPIPDRPGFYLAPGETGRIDGRGFASGTVLQSPYSQKYYRIP